MPRREHPPLSIATSYFIDLVRSAGEAHYGGAAFTSVEAFATAAESGEPDGFVDPDLNLTIGRYSSLRTVSLFRKVFFNGRNRPIKSGIADRERELRELINRAGKCALACRHHLIEPRHLYCVSLLSITRFPPVRQDEILGMLDLLPRFDDSGKQG